MNKIILEDLENIIEKTDSIYKLNNKNILLIGGTGFFAKWFIILIDYLNNMLDFNINLTITIRSYEKFISEFSNIIDINKYSYIESDIESLKLDNKDFNFVLYFAGPDKYLINGQKLYDMVVEGTKNIISIFNNTNIEKLIFTSSGAVYGNSNSFRESDICKPIIIYGEAKKYAEELLLQSNINVSVARCFAFNGPYNKEKHQFLAISSFIDNVINNKDIIINGNGRNLRSYLYTADLVIWLLAILLKSENKSIYNVGGGGGVSLFMIWLIKYQNPLIIIEERLKF